MIQQKMFDAALATPFAFLVLVDEYDQLSKEDKLLWIHTVPPAAAAMMILVVVDYVDDMFVKIATLANRFNPHAGNEMIEALVAHVEKSYNVRVIDGEPLPENIKRDMEQYVENLDASEI